MRTNVCVCVCVCVCVRLAVGQVVHPSLLLELVQQRFAPTLSELDVELILTIVKGTGHDLHPHRPAAHAGTCLVSVCVRRVYCVFFSSVWGCMWGGWGTTEGAGSLLRTQEPVAFKAAIAAVQASANAPGRPASRSASPLPSPHTHTVATFHINISTHMTQAHIRTCTVHTWACVCGCAGWLNGRPLHWERGFSVRARYMLDTVLAVRGHKRVRGGLDERDGRVVALAKWVRGLLVRRGGSSGTGAGTGGVRVTLADLDAAATQGAFVYVHVCVCLCMYVCKRTCVCT
jgi:hypothetical protein